MKRKLLLTLLVLAAGTAVAQDKAETERVIYKWVDGGLVYYSHILPKGVSDYTKLNSRGMEIKDYTEEFETIETIAVRPKTLEKTDKKEDQQAKTDDNSPEAIKAKNCEIAKANLRLLSSGDVYDKDDKGNLVTMNKEQVESKRKNTQEDIDYYCK